MTNGVIFENKILYFSDCLFVLEFKKNLVFVNCLIKQVLKVQIDSSISRVMIFLFVPESC